LLPQSRNGQALFKRIPYSTSIKGENFNTINSLITTHLDTVIDCRGWGVVPYLPKNRDKLPKTKELRTTATTHKICWVDTSGIHLRKSN
jgi:hypothetical protein